MEDLMARELPPDLARAVGDELHGGERIQWSGQPQVSWFPLGSLPLVLFGIPWTAFALFWMYMAGWLGGAWSHGGGFGLGTIFSLFGLPFVIIGLWMLTSPYWMRRRALRTAYVITDTRAFILVAARNVRVQSFDAAQLDGIETLERPDGTGDVVLQTQQGPGGNRFPSAGFLRVPEVKRVKELLQHLHGTLSPPR